MYKFYGLIVMRNDSLVVGAENSGYGLQDNKSTEGCSKVLPHASQPNCYCSGDCWDTCCIQVSQYATFEAYD